MRIKGINSIILFKYITVVSQICSSHLVSIKIKNFMTMHSYLVTFIIHSAGYYGLFAKSKIQIVKEYAVLNIFCWTHDIHCVKIMGSSITMKKIAVKRLDFAFTVYERTC